MYRLSAKLNCSAIMIRETVSPLAFGDLIVGKIYVRQTTSLGATECIRLYARQWAPDFPGALIAISSMSRMSRPVALPLLGNSTLILRRPIFLPYSHWPAMAVRG